MNLLIQKDFIKNFKYLNIIHYKKIEIFVFNFLFNFLIFKAYKLIKFTFSLINFF
jgi:hypothetical protein